MEKLGEHITSLSIAFKNHESLLHQVLDKQDKRQEQNYLGIWELREEFEALKDYLGLEYKEEGTKITKKIIKRKCK